MKKNSIIINAASVLFACISFAVYYVFNSPLLNLEGASAYAGAILGNSLPVFGLILILSLIVSIITKAITKKSYLPISIKVLWVVASVFLAISSITITPENIDLKRVAIVFLLTYGLGWVVYRNTLK